MANIPNMDHLITEFDTALRTLFAKPHSVRAHPDADISSSQDAAMTEAERKHVSALMRVNHTGEVCAQALYSGQSLTAKRPAVTQALKQAAIEETEHLAWCESRITELGGRTSLLNPLFYAGAFTMGAAAGILGDKWNLGFLAETEKQVGAHLESHLSKLPEGDEKTRKIVEQMQQDEARHAKEAMHQGGAHLPKPAQMAMEAVSKVMTTASYYI